MIINWREQWEHGNIPFHLNFVNPFLEQYWPALKASAHETILVPLCGKTLDMLWFAKQGHSVIGVELSEFACEAFFSENKLTYNKSKQAKFICYDSEKIKIYCGDFFELTAEMLPVITTVYDRAALVALPKELRKLYVAHLGHLMGSKSKMLLMTLDSPDDVQGPPYSVTFEEVKSLFGAEFQVKELARIEKNEFSSHLAMKGYTVINDAVYLISKI